MSVVVTYSIKSGKVVVVLAGRYAGRKAVVMSASEEGSGDKKFGHCTGKFQLLLDSSINKYLI